MALSSKSSVSEISVLLREMGEDKLADRLDYLASDEDLDPGESPATDESARGFLALYSSVKWDSEFGLACSPEGWIVGEWRFPDQRRASVWFLDEEKVMFTAKTKRGEFVSIKGHGNFSELSTLTKVLVQEELFSWRPNQDQA